MNNAKHTPGKWQLNEYKDCIWSDTATDPIIAERPNGGIGKDNFTANAALIAASPEMLQGLQDALVALNTFANRAVILGMKNTTSYVIANRIESIIKKAKGDK